MNIWMNGRKESGRKGGSEGGRKKDTKEGREGDSLKCQPSPPPNPQGALRVRGRRRLTFQTRRERGREGGEGGGRD